MSRDGTTRADRGAPRSDEAPRPSGLRDLTLDELRAAMGEMGQPAWRAGQVFAGLYRRRARSVDDLADVPKSLRAALAERFSLAPLSVEGRLRSADGVEKFVFDLGDGCVVETVRIPAGARATLCLSTQVGCKFACAFCASGARGFTRQLSPGEITGQVLDLPDGGLGDLTNFVFMGMGEPLDNFDRLAKAIRIMNAPEGMGVAARRMTVSTAGHVPGIRRLAALDLQVNLSLSLHAPDDRLRSELMPINRRWPLEEVVRACEAYLAAGGRMMTLEYALIDGVNDGPREAEGLAGIARRLRAKVNLIPCSPVAGRDFRSPPEERVEAFVRRLTERRVRVTVRRSKGADILAACGQLAGRARRCRA